MIQKTPAGFVQVFVAILRKGAFVFFEVTECDEENADAEEGEDGVGGEGGGEVAGRHGLDDAAHQLGGDGSTEVATCREEGKGGDARIFDVFFHQDERAWPEHRGEEADEDAGDEGDNGATREADREVADGRECHTDEEHRGDFLTETRVADTGKTEEDGEYGNAQNVTEGFVDTEGAFHKAREPVAHHIFRATSCKDTADAKCESDGSFLGADEGLFAILTRHIGHRRCHKQSGGDGGKESEDKHKPGPVFVSEYL